ncbi:MarR family EPS-associated transcriptional regulator [Roseobacter sp.]|uniref:MarR family EPS-associated transcriptional regulator n=1 Tax=Roseobacter sp. TaxID=1907202 RepID=UPI00385D6D57
MKQDRNCAHDDARFRVLRLLWKNPEISQRMLANAIGMSLGRTHYILSALIEADLIRTCVPAATKDKRKCAYVLTPKGIAAKNSLTTRFLERRRLEYDALEEEIKTLEAEQETRSEHSPTC